MTLPITLLPSGALNVMRSTADSFMVTPAVLYNIVNTYSIYGEPVQSSGVLWSGLAYIGDVSAKDVDLFRSTDFYISRTDGREVKYLATVLMPYNVQVDTYNKVKILDKEWEVVWHNRAVTQGVRVYTKVIVRDKYYE